MKNDNDKIEKFDLCSECRGYTKINQTCPTCLGFGVEIKLKDAGVSVARKVSNVVPFPHAGMVE